jgi:asparagine synthase (glutamine-hydrolysing)
MMPQPFLLAVPRERIRTAGIDRVYQPNDVLSDSPALWCDPTTRVIGLGGHGVVIGPLFEGKSPAVRAFSDCGSLESVAGVEIAARLVRQYWGAYFAVLVDPANGNLAGLSDPSGLLPVYRTETRSHVVLASDPRLFTAAGMAAPAVSWRDLRTHLVRPDLRRADTCLAGVRELPCGVLVPLAGRADDGVRVWRPDDFIPRGSAPDLKDAAAALRACTIETVGAWAGFAGPVAVAASGGVDSSLICAALAEDGHAFDCLTLATSDPSCDERAYVQALASALGVRCVAATYDTARIEPRRSASLGLPRPARKTFMQAFDAALDDGRRDLGAAAVFDGNGGDSLFCFVHSATPVLDCLASAGLGQALGVFVDMCGLTGCDILTMAGAVGRRARRAWRGETRYAWPPDPRLLADNSGADQALDPLLPWLDAHVGGQHGKREHLGLLMKAQNNLNRLGTTAVPRFSPLLSQPMVELCLALPTWLWSQGGINRAPARAAFADILPLSVRRRTSKSGPDSFIRRLFAAHLEVISELLLDGLLVKHGIADRDAVETALATDVLSGDDIVYRLLDFLEAETWARSWGG